MAYNQPPAGLNGFTTLPGRRPANNRRALAVRGEYRTLLFRRRPGRRPALTRPSEAAVQRVAPCFPTGKLRTGAIRPGRCDATTERRASVALLRAWNAGQPFRLARKSFPHGRPRQSPKAETQVEDPRSGLTSVADRALPNARDRPALLIAPGTQPGDGRIDGGVSAGAAPPYLRCGGRGGRAPCQPNVRTLGKLAMTLNRCHSQLCAREVFSPSQPLPCGLAGRRAGVIEVARALCCLWSVAVTGCLFPA